MSADLNKVISMYCPNLLTVEEAKEIFQKFDYDKNEMLDFKELQHFNAFIFQKFPRMTIDTELGSFKKGDKQTKKENNNDENVAIPTIETEHGNLPHNLDIFGNLYRVFKIKTLAYLDLSFQSIKKIPGAVSSLTNLKVLKLKYCVYLEILSSKLGLLKLNELDLTGCISLKTPPLEIQKRGVNSVLAYLNRLTSGSVKCKRTKLMLQGLGGAGKTSLMQALLHKIYQNSSTPPPNVTDGISICDWKVKLDTKDADENDEIIFSLWDFAGQVNSKF